MNIVYLASSKRDIAWWRRYYRVSFPEGQRSAGRHYLATLRLLIENPAIGRPVDDLDIRQLAIPHTPFKLIYRIRNHTIEIVRLWDTRQQPTHGFQEG